MSIHHYLLILLDGEQVPDRLDFDSTNGNAEHVRTSDLNTTIQGWGPLKFATRTGGPAVTVRAVKLDTYGGDCEECKSAAEIRDFKVYLPNPSLHVEEI